MFLFEISLFPDCVEKEVDNKNLIIETPDIKIAKTYFLLLKTTIKPTRVSNFVPSVLIR